MQCDAGEHDRTARHACRSEASRPKVDSCLGEWCGFSERRGRAQGASRTSGCAASMAGWPVE